MLSKHVDSVFPTDVEQMIEELIPLPAAGKLRELNANLRQAVKAGFVMAMARYSRELRQNAKALSIIEARHRGTRNGHAAASRRRQTQAEKIRGIWAAMEAAGETPTNAKVASAAKCSVSTVIRAFRDKP
jgi:DNA invertase Pin-like site-specific DNA recombinase